jgi:EmrB/QacA subfamily drug resistance transporter
VEWEGNGVGSDAVRGAGVDQCRRFALPALLLGSFMGVLDPFVVTVALPAIRSDLGASAAQSQWTVAGYAAMYGTGLVLGGRLGDRHGRRRLFLAGMTGYVAASLVAGTAPAADVLVGARLVQGLAAAAVLPQVLSIIRSGYPERERERAVGWYGATIGLGVVCGPVFGGLLVGADVAGLGWRTAFLANLPLGAVVLAGVALTVAESRGDGVRQLDLLGACLGAAAVLALLVPVSQGPESGWPWWAAALLAAVPVLLAGFLLHERRHRAPVLPLRLFAERRFSAGIVVVLLMYAAGAGAPLVFVLTHYVQDGLGRSPLEAGLVFAPLGLGFAVASAVAPRMYRRGGAAVPSAGCGVVVVALGALVLVATAAPVGLRSALLATVLLVAGIGQGLAVNPVITLVLTAAPDSTAGAASGLLLTCTQVGNVVGVTGVGGVFLALLRPGPAGLAAYGPALAWSLALLAAATVAALVIVATLLGRGGVTCRTPEPSSCRRAPRRSW